MEQFLMSALLPFLAAHKAVTAAVLAAAVGVPTTAVAMTGDHMRTAAVVQRVVDGDTIDVTYDGSTHRIRLLNVDTPETVNPDKPVQCMGPEAVKFLRQRLPNGKAVSLSFDEERTDRYQRELAGVFADGKLVNADIARAGFGTAVNYEPNDRFYEDVLKAQDEAEARREGLYSSELKCTLPAQVTQLEQDATALVATKATSTADLGALQQHQRALSAALNRSKRLTALLSDPSRDFDTQAYRAVVHEDLTRRVAGTALSLTQAGTSAKDRAQSIARTKVERAKQRARAEAERVEAERAEAERAEAARAKKRAKARKAAARAAEREAAERAEERAEARERRREAERAAEKAAAEKAATEEAAAKKAAAEREAEKAAARKVAAKRAAEKEAAVRRAAAKREAEKAAAPQIAAKRAADKKAATKNAPGGCTPGYLPCLPPASDYDCSGGSGNGPGYVKGPVQVKGADPYDLDRDGDGRGCDS